MERKDIEEKYTWDLSKIYQDPQEFYHDIEVSQQLLDELTSFKGKMTESVDILLRFLSKRDEMSMLVSKAYCFAHLNCDVEPKEQEYQKMLATVMSLIQQSSVKLVFVDNEIVENDETVREYLKDERLKSYRYSLENALAFKPHLLDKEQEELVAKVDNISELAEQVFDSLRLEFEDVEVNGQKKTLNQATLNEFLKNKNRDVRKQAYHHFFKEYQRFENTFASTLSGVMKKDAFYSDIRHFDSPLAASVFNDDVPTDLFFKILDKANNEYRYLFHRYNHLKKEILGLDELYNYDLSVPLVKSVSKKFTIEECFDIINQALAPFGKDYLAIINRAKDERWIDYYPTTGKRGGAYSSGSYLTQPYILMNFIGDYNSLSTMIHELGHSVHTYLSSHNQDYENSDYRIFVAEVASTVNENLLMELLIKNSTNPEEKKYLLYKKLDEFIGCCYRQPFFANFENVLHQKVANNEGLSNQAITDLYEKLSDEYYGEKVQIHELTKYTCYGVPHFYYNYYVYKYTVGMCVASVIAKRIFNGDKEQIENYLKFLKSGSTKSPVELLTMAGVNPLDENLYKEAFENFKKDLEEFKSSI